MRWTAFASPFSPWRELDRMHAEMDRLRDAGRGVRNDSYAPGFPPVNVWTAEDEAVLAAELPGLEPDKIEISVVDGTVTLSGSREPEGVRAGEGAEVAFRHRERGFGRFSRSFELPFRIESSGVDARYSNGILEVTLPRAEADRPKKVPVLAA